MWILMPTQAWKLAVTTTGGPLVWNPHALGRMTCFRSFPRRHSRSRSTASLIHCTDRPTHARLLNTPPALPPPPTRAAQCRLLADQPEPELHVSRFLQRRIRPLFRRCLSRHSDVSDVEKLPDCFCVYYRRCSCEVLFNLPVTSCGRRDNGGMHDPLVSSETTI